MDFLDFIITDNEKESEKQLENLGNTSKTVSGFDMSNVKKERCKVVSPDIVDFAESIWIEQDDLPPEKPCEYCHSQGKDNKMQLRFLSSNDAVYICDKCDEVYPDDGTTLKKDICDYPYLKEDIERLGYPVKLLSHFPVLKADTLKKMIKVLNCRWRDELNGLWNKCVEIDERMSKALGETSTIVRNQLIPTDDPRWKHYFDLSSCTKDELLKLNRAIDDVGEKLLWEAIKKIRRRPKRKSRNKKSGIKDNNDSDKNGDSFNKDSNSHNETYNSKMNSNYSKSAKVRKNSKLDITSLPFSRFCGRIDNEYFTQVRSLFETVSDDSSSDSSDEESNFGDEGNSAGDDCMTTENMVVDSSVSDIGNESVKPGCVFVKLVVKNSASENNIKSGNIQLNFESQDENDSTKHASSDCFSMTVLVKDSAVNDNDSVCSETACSDDFEVYKNNYPNLELTEKLPDKIDVNEFFKVEHEALEIAKKKRKRKNEELSNEMTVVKKLNTTNESNNRKKNHDTRMSLLRSRLTVNSSLNLSKENIEKLLAKSTPAFMPNVDRGYRNIIKKHKFIKRSNLRHVQLFLARCPNKQPCISEKNTDSIQSKGTHTVSETVNNGEHNYQKSNLEFDSKITVDRN